MLRMKFSRMVFCTLVFAMLAAVQCAGMEPSQEPSQIINIRQKAAVDDLQGCLPSLPSFSSTPPIESPTLLGSSGEAHSSQAADQHSNQQDPHERAITIADLKQKYSLNSPRTSISDAQTPSSDHQSISIIPPRSSNAPQDPESDACSICKDEEVRGAMIKLNCPHQFHEQCIRAWLILPKTTCPECRTEVEPETASTIIGHLSRSEVVTSVDVAQLPDKWDVCNYATSSLLFLVFLFVSLYFLGKAIG
ncbi:uncharacterized protein PGTG_06072 [Puccinia graminis f. sp. tritici CRL 75-36-700-3]|uniref:RING-type domain-containing protein n=2 Tax=Puccinia graminis f. sp. tritici (strain CRL 75-36-700-3 / race SCCL) TaxID=418459 RepID=E3K5H5_PUCGT|nr:uncharacterized protein PGTG_06072 [Puccinia graminis f. sp. tritici CRL 75-36-700-3]EFP79751.2 hypothetical protein PGTG_06072 [Puccinia graminis f. sp. tritici CRL 75-36-700-3]